MHLCTGVITKQTIVLQQKNGIQLFIQKLKTIDHKVYINFWETSREWTKTIKQGVWNSENYTSAKLCVQRLLHNVMQLLMISYDENYNHSQWPFGMGGVVWVVLVCTFIINLFYWLTQFWEDLQGICISVKNFLNIILKRLLMYNFPYFDPKRCVNCTLQTVNLIMYIYLFYMYIDLTWV